MPRIYTSQSNPVDFCHRCFNIIDEEEMWERFGDLGDGPDRRGNCYDYNSDHPPYDDNDYDCEECGKRLTDDNA